MRKFSDTQPKQELEPERLQLVDGISIIITKIVLSDKTQYGLIGKIDGISPINNQPLKYYTTSQVVATQLAEILKSDRTGTDGILRDPTTAAVKKVRSKNGSVTYLTLADPA